MEKEVIVLHETVREMQTTCKFVLKRLNELPQNPHQCTCCNQLEASKKDILELNNKLRQLKEKDEERDIILQKFQLQIKDLLLKQDSLQSELSLMVQTDDSKLLHASSKGANKDVDNTHRDTDSDFKSSKANTAEETKTTLQTITAAGQRQSMQLLPEKPDDTNSQNKTSPVRADMQTDITICDTSSNSKLQKHTLNKDQTNATAENKVNECEDPANTSDDQVSAPNSVTFARSDPIVEHNTSKTNVQDKAGAALNTGVANAGNERSTAMGATSVPKHSPNFSSEREGKPSNSAGAVVEVIEQRYKKYKEISEWNTQILLQSDEGRKAGKCDARGVHTVILLDISESMKDAWPQVQTFFNDYIDGLELLEMQYGISEDNVALVTFGHETKIQQWLTNNLNLVREQFNRLKVGGPSPMTPGFKMALTAAGGSGQVCVVNHAPVLPKLIIITDCEPTEPELYEGPDVADLYRLELTKMYLITDMEAAQQTQLDLFFVPVGKANMELLELFMSISEGKMLSYKDGRQLSRRTYLTIHSNPLGLGSVVPRNEIFSEQDHLDIKEIEEKSKIVHERGLDGSRSYEERSDGKLPAPGSRVRRGPDWRYDDIQDQHMPGTITGHATGDDSVWVDWDTDAPGCYQYRYGKHGSYDVLLVDETRVPEPGTLMAIGCQVEPGPGWKGDTGKADCPDKGVVLKLFLDSSNIPKALVRWSSTYRGEYTYMSGTSTIAEVVLCSKVTPGSQGPQQAHPEPAKKYHNKNKNKNKNKNL